MKENLSATIDINIRFSETDAMGVVWHGNYVKFFEDGREAFGAQHDIPYLRVSDNGYFVPVVKLEADYKSAVFYGTRLRIITTYIPSKAAKIIFEYRILNMDTGELVATGKTVQVFIDKEKRQLQLLAPDFYQDWLKKAGLL